MVILLYVPCSTYEEATAIGRKLVEEHLVACANVFNSTSIYWWRKRMYQGGEGILIAKTTKAKASKVEKRIKQLHSYDLPAIIQIKGDSNKKYEAWVKESMKAKKVRVKKKVGKRKSKRVKRKKKKRAVKKSKRRKRRR